MHSGRFALAGLVVLSLSSFGATAQTGTGSSPDPDVKDVLSNGRVSVRDTTWRHDRPRATNHFQDSVTVYLEGGRLRISKPNGASAVVTRQTGEVVADPKGDPDTREAVDAPVRGIVVELHDNVVPGLANTSGYPEAFPRPGSKKVLETARVIVWDFTFAPGQSTPMHFHSRDVVTVYTEDGAVASTTPQGERIVADHVPGEVRFNPRGRIHTEQLARGQVHIIAVELT